MLAGKVEVGWHFPFFFFPPPQDPKLRMNAVWVILMFLARIYVLKINQLSSQSLICFHTILWMTGGY